MTKRQDNLSVWLITNAWREIFSRIFDNETSQLNLSPDWLINPATNRKLKLDIIYPDLSVAVRFEGLQGKQRRRLSLEEEAQMQVRQDARIEVCRTHGIYLIMVQTATDEPRAVFQKVDAALSRAIQDIPDKADLTKLKQCRSIAARLSRKIGSLGDLKLYADLWQDRQYQVPEPASSNLTIPAQTYFEGMEVEHISFGPGVVIKTTASDDDILVMVDFITAGQKTLMASLVADKLLPR